MNSVMGKSVNSSSTFLRPTRHRRRRKHRRSSSSCGISTFLTLSSPLPPPTGVFPELYSRGLRPHAWPHLAQHVKRRSRSCDNNVRPPAHPTIPNGSRSTPDVSYCTQIPLPFIDPHDLMHEPGDQAALCMDTVTSQRGARDRLASLYWLLYPCVPLDQALVNA